MIDLDQKYIDFIKDIIKTKLQSCKIYMFGSRVKGCARKYSDIDIALEDADLNDEILLKIQTETEESTLPYKVDFINLNKINDSFKKQIANDLTEI